MTFKQLGTVLLLVGAVLAAPAIHAQTQIIDQVVAIVDDDVIMASELRERVAAVQETIKARGVTAPPEDELIRETLDRLILESIQLQKGTRVGVRISDEQLNGAVERIAAQNRMSIDEFRRALESQGQSYAQMREQLRKEMIIQRVQAGNVNQRIQITEQEVENFVSTQEGQKLTQPEYRILHALLPLSPDASESEVNAAEAHVNKMLRRIRGGEPFEAVVSTSRPPYAFSGGDLGWRKLDDLPSLFSDVAPALKKGETAEPIRSDSGFHLVYMADTSGGERMIAQTKVRHILVKPSEIMTDEEARELTQQLRNRVLNGEDFAELAREYSEDIGSAAEGGDLGWASPGQMVPEFEQAMAATDIGEVSQPVRSQFGWHILQVEGRRDQDMTNDAARAKAMNYLHDRKYQEELDAWLRQIRDEAFVDIK
ncbi:MAG: peptidylprolyl isomerase [Gammaproteobacteria bacterium]|nr:peptidylprolyl isomerase [Gammaproteobacteria bacterium]